jgi:xanthine dehydrogenase YagR molybdenum-binding subunit
MPVIRKTKVEFEGRIEEREVIVEEERVEPWDGAAQLRLVGKPVSRVDGAARVTGQAIYTSDVQLPRMLIGRILRSPHPHARLVAVDSARAEAMGGVWLVWHRDQLPPVLDLGGKPLFPDELTHEGDVVAFVVADDERVVDDALSAIEVAYHNLPFVVGLAAARAEDAPPALAQSESNIVDREGTAYGRGDVQRGLDEADVTVDLEFSTQVAAHCCMETHGSVARWEGDQLTLYHSTQGVFAARETMAEALGIDQDKVRAICEYVGGGFGSKWGAENYSLLAALASRETGRPVRVMLDRRDEHLVAGYRPSSRQRVRLGARRDGTLTLIEHEVWEDTGILGGAGHIVTGPAKDLYACPNVRTVVWAVRSNVDSARAFRAPGYVEGTFALEGAMDALAEKLGLDPLDLRLKNYAEDSPQRSIPYTTKGLRAAYDTGAERFGWYHRNDSERAHGPIRRGFGLASQIWGGGGGPPANALVKLLADGTAEVLAGVQDIGTGTKTVLAQVAAEEMGLPLEAVRVVIGDTLPTPFGPGSGGSVTLASVTPAVRAAAHDALWEFLGLAAYVLDVPDAPAEDFEVVDGDITYRLDPTKRTTYAQVAARMGGYTIIGRGGRGPNPDDKAINTFGAHFVEVEVNVETGQVRVCRAVAAHDIGRVVNPLTAISQVYGGFTMGLGFGLSEERVIDPSTGLQLTANLEGYKVPLVCDIPDIDVVFIGEADPEANSVGAKGLGEPPIIPAPAAIANAVSDALGVRVTELPVTPDRVLRAWSARGEEAR